MEGSTIIVIIIKFLETIFANKLFSTAFAFFLNCIFIYIVYKSKKVLKIEYFTYKHFFCVCTFALIYSFFLFLFSYYFLKLTSYDSLIITIQIFNLVIFIFCFIAMLFKSFLYKCKKFNVNDSQTFIILSREISNKNNSFFVKIFVVNVNTIILIDSRGHFNILKFPVYVNSNNVLLCKLYLSLWLIIYIETCITLYTEVISIPVTKKVDSVFVLLINKRINDYLEELLSDYCDTK